MVVVSYDVSTRTPQGNEVPWCGPCSAVALAVRDGGVAAAGSFMVSHQIYTDLSVMPLAALFLGAALSGPRWCAAPEPAPKPVSASSLRANAPRIPA